MDTDIQYGRRAMSQHGGRSAPALLSQAPLSSNIPKHSTDVFQNDGTPCHYAVIVQNYLNNWFPERWIGQGAQVYRTEVDNFQMMRDGIRQAVAQITPWMLQNAFREAAMRFDLCRDTDGPLQDCRRQCYDSARNTRGHVKYVQAITSLKDNRAIYIHSFSCSLKFCSRSLPLVREPPKLLEQNMNASSPVQYSRPEQFLKKQYIVVTETIKDVIETDFQHPLEAALLVPKALQIPAWMNLIHPFSSDTWIAYISMFGFLVLISRFIARFDVHTTPGQFRFLEILRTQTGMEPATKNRTGPITKPGTKSGRTRLEMLRRSFPEIELNLSEFVVLKQWLGWPTSLCASPQRASERPSLKLEFLPTHDLVQFLSGHGNFKAKLFDMGLVDDPQCDDCLVPHTMAHVLHDCVRIEDLRELLKWKLSLLGLDFDLAVIKAADSDAKALLSEFARKVMRRLSVGNRARDERLAAGPLQLDFGPETRVRTSHFGYSCWSKPGRLFCGALLGEVRTCTTRGGCHSGRLFRRARGSTPDPDLGSSPRGEHARVLDWTCMPYWQHDMHANHPPQLVRTPTLKGGCGGSKVSDGVPRMLKSTLDMHDKIFSRLWSTRSDWRAMKNSEMEILWKVGIYSDHSTLTWRNLSRGCESEHRVYIVARSSSHTLSSELVQQRGLSVTSRVGERVLSQRIGIRPKCMRPRQGQEINSGTSTAAVPCRESRMLKGMGAGGGLRDQTRSPADLEVAPSRGGDDPQAAA
ncbi:hypothetical protein PR048_025230 [Dryococelus australis]|uniref:Reverse transcriptase n=1 Tax=Dryococelus australis TaxID=614101 RepID=A0ABQ9GQP7_9NEOP|nr:hypothetical protein PR048_025230 [Dryococelus australis]